MLPNYDPDKQLTGKVLAAAPDLLDPNFRESLVFMAQHDEEGAFGLILNRPTGKRLGDVLDASHTSPEVADLPLMLGGPVSPKSVLVAVFEKGPSSAGIIHCRITGADEDVAALIQKEETWVRAFAGYSGWGGGQLEGELMHDSWKICAASSALFNEQLLEGLWKLYVDDDNPWLSLLPYLPQDPSKN